MNDVIRALLVGTVLAAAGEISAAAEQSPRPNIILILIDDLGWADLGCYGADLHETPHIDRLAKSGVRFTTAYASAPVCSPTRAAIMTGKHPARLNMTTWREGSFTRPKDRRLIPPPSVADLSREEHSLAKALKAAGYLTAHLGKWHLGDASHFPESHGFEVHLGGNHFGAPASHFYPYRGKTSDDYRYVPHMEWGKPGEYLTDRLTDEALRVMDRAGDRPFFLNLWHYTVHTPLQAPADLVEAYERKLRPELRHQNATYAAMIKNLDDNIGRMLKFLDDRKLAERTIVIFTSDNGGLQSVRQEHYATSNHPLRSGKGSLYEGGIRVPLLVRWPGVTAAGGKCAVPVVSADLYPTILEMAGVSEDDSVTTDIDGVSLAGVLKSPAAKLPRDTLCWHFPHYYHHTTTTPVSAIRAGDWKLLEYAEDDRLELYHLSEDPSESTDLARTHAADAARLQAKLHAWKQDVRAQQPTVNPAYGGGNP